MTEGRRNTKGGTAREKKQLKQSGKLAGEKSPKRGKREITKMIHEKRLGRREGRGMGGEWERENVRME